MDAALPRMRTELFGYSILQKAAFEKKPPQGKKGIAINVMYQQGLEEIAGALGAMGYQMHPMSSRIAADAVLYTSDARSALSVCAPSAGAVLLCVRGMDAAQIGRALRRRSCQQLF